MKTENENANQTHPKVLSEDVHYPLTIFKL